MLRFRTFTASVTEDSYSDGTVRSKLSWLVDFGQWLGRTGFAVTNLDELLMEAFVKDKQRIRRGDLKTLRQFLGHLRKRDVVPDRKSVRDRSPLADILSRYEKHLRLERGPVTATILN